MSGIWKNNIGLSIFGESHGTCVGITIDGLKPGLIIDEAFIQKELDRRKPGKHPWETARKEADQLNIVSGVFNNRTTGAPLTLIIENTNTRSKDYDNIENRLRPGHADFTAKVKYKGYSDFRGGGHFSGRLTAGLVFAGAIAKSIIQSQDIEILSQIKSIGGVEDVEMTLLNRKDWPEVNQGFPVVNEKKAHEMKSTIEAARQAGDSVGGCIRCLGFNVPAGLGDPFFESFESILSQLIFSIPGVKGLEFGSGFKLGVMKGSNANDAYYYEDEIKTSSNHNGGILGGITNGMPIDFTVVIKPTPSISMKQKSVDFVSKEAVDLVIEGRHDPCIVPRAIPVVEGVLAIAILDRLMTI